MNRWLPVVALLGLTRARRLRRWLYQTQIDLGDAIAVADGKAPQRIARKAIQRQAGKATRQVK